MTLVLVRHLATAWTVAGRLQGRHDEPILAGASPSPAVIARLATMPSVPAWCSTLRRTRETADRFVWTNAIPSPLLDELDFGAFEGRTRDELLAATSGDWRTAPFTTVLEPALVELEGRIDAFLSLVRAGQGPGLVFGHGVWIRMLVAKVRGGDSGVFNRIAIEPGALIEVAS